MGDVDILFVDKARQYEVDTFYDACQLHRNYYRGFEKAYHPLTYFKQAGYMWQCAPDMTSTYLEFPLAHVRYRQPAVLPVSTARTTGVPSNPGRMLGPRYNKLPCKAYVR